MSILPAFFAKFLVLFMSDVRCPHCGEGFRLPDFSLPAGTTAACPWCKSRLSIATLRAGSPPLAELFAPDGNPLQFAFSLTDSLPQQPAYSPQPIVTPAQPIIPSAPTLTDSPGIDHPSDVSSSHHSDRWATRQETALEPAPSIAESAPEIGPVSEIVERFTTQLEPLPRDRTAESRTDESRTAEPRVTRPIRTAPRPVPPGSPGLRQVIQVVAGGLFAIPLAAAILAMLGKPLPIDLGFWPFLGSSPQTRDLLALRPAEPAPLNILSPRTDRPPADDRAIPSPNDAQAPANSEASAPAVPGDTPKLAANPPQLPPQAAPGGLVMPTTPKPSVEPESPPRNMPQEANLYDDNYDAAAAKRAVSGPTPVSPEPDATQNPSAKTAQAPADSNLGTDRSPLGETIPPLKTDTPAAEPIAQNPPTLAAPVTPETATDAETAGLPETAPDAKLSAAEPSVAAVIPIAEPTPSNTPATTSLTSPGPAAPPTPDLTLLDYAKGMVAAIKSLNEHKPERDGIAELKRRWAELYVQIAGAADVATPNDRASMARISGKLIESGMTARVVKIAPTWVTSSRRLNGGLVAAGVVAQESGKTFIRWSGESPLEVRGLDPKLIASPEPLLVWGRIVEDSPSAVVEVTFAQAIPSYVLSD